ncbi:hypothetical protein [Leptolyngbya iicbica]|nr:hypothetical protein [Leptolyngbya sp. LK]
MASLQLRYRLVVGVAIKPGDGQGRSRLPSLTFLDSAVNALQ